MILYVLFFKSSIFQPLKHVTWYIRSFFMLCRSFEGSGLDEECRDKRQCTKKDVQVWVSSTELSLLLLVHLG